MVRLIVTLLLVAASAHSQSLAPTAPSYEAGEAIRIEFSGFAGTAQDAIAVATPGSPDATHLVRLTTSGAATGKLAFGNLPAGTYVARAFNSTAGPAISESAPFEVHTSVNFTGSAWVRANEDDDDSDDDALTPIT